MISALVACANVSSDYKLEGSDAGLLVGSMTTAIGIGHYRLMIVAEESGKPVHPGPRFGSAMYPAIPPMHDAELKQDGATFAVALSPGRYLLQGWSLKQGYHESVSTKPFSVPFEVEAGRATYLGNVHWRRDWRMVLSDKADRDLPILQKRYPTLARAPVSRSIEPGAEVVGLGGNTATTLRIPVFIPVPVR